MTRYVSYDNIQNIVENDELYFGEVNGLQRIKIFLWLLLLAAAVLVSACRSTDDTVVRIGIVEGPQADIMREVKKVAAKDGLRLELIACSDYMEPNRLLEKGEIAANSYQPQPFLAAQQLDRGYDFAVLAKTVLFPVGLYSRRVQSLADLPPGAQVALPEDALNGSRALQLLAAAGLITLKPEALAEPTLAAVADNPRNLQFKEVDATAIGPLAATADLLVMGTSCAQEAGFSPRRDALFLEQADSPYANVIAVRSADAANDVLKKLVKAYHSPEVKDFIERDMGGIAIAAW